MQATIANAKARLDRLAFYPRPVRTRWVRIIHVPWLFALPWFRRFVGYALGPLILVRDADPHEDLIVHELCHVWQTQHGLVRMWLSYLWQGYEHNPNEIQARLAVRLTRTPPDVGRPRRRQS